MSEAPGSKGGLGKLVAIGAVLYAYETFRPPTMPGIMETLFPPKDGGTAKAKATQDTSSRPTPEPSQPQESGPALAPEGNHAGLTGPAYDAYMRRQRAIQEVRDGFAWWFETYLRSACNVARGQQALDRARENEESKTEHAWGGMSRVGTVAEGNSVHFVIGQQAIEALQSVVFVLDGDLTPKERELMSLVGADWEEFLMGLRVTSSGPLTDAFAVPCTCADVDRNGSSWPWGGSMSFERLRDQTVANYRLKL